MRVTELVSRCPKLYHMAEAESWPSIQKHGLLSTSALLDKFELTGSARYSLESQWRPGSVPITHPIHGKAVLRDQSPMPPTELQQYLKGISSQEWYELINHKTFFWVDTKRLRWMLKARPYINRAHWVLTADSRSLLDRHLEKVTLSDQNSGSVLSRKQRGRNTFKPVENYQSKWVAELAVEYSVPDIADFTICVEEWRGDEQLRVIWGRG